MRRMVGSWKAEEEEEEEEGDWRPCWNENRNWTR